MAGREDIFKIAMSAGQSDAWDRQWDQAAAQFQKALDEFPENPKALSSLGLALFELQRYDESLHVFQKAAQAAPTDPVPLEKVGKLSERIGDTREAIRSFMKAAELYLKSRDSEKAIANWVCVTQLDTEQLNAHLYLAMVHERLGHLPQAISEYLIGASLLQRAGKVDKASEMVGRALRLAPKNSEVRQAQIMLKNGQLLPKPLQSQGGTGPLRVAQVKHLVSPRDAGLGLDPVAEARKLALAHLAEVVFEFSDGAGAPQEPRRGMQSIVRGSGDQNPRQNENNTVMLHIGQAIDAQSRGQESQAAEELEQALIAGFSDAALLFYLGLLQSKTDRLDEALNSLQTAVKHADYALATRLLLGQIQRQRGRLPEAVTEYMEALKTADASVVPPQQADELRQLYEPLIEANTHQSDPAVMEHLCDNIQQLLLRPDWQAQVLQAREQLPKPEADMPPMPLAEILSQAHSSQVIESIGRVRALARTGHLQSAMDEAFESFKYAPTYLPLHALVGDLLIQEGDVQGAIAKYSVVAEAYGVRGETTQAVNLLRRIVQVAPMDLQARTRLINQLAARGLVDEAIGEYIDLADIYYHLAELDMARETFATALNLAQRGGANGSWNAKLMRRMADIDMQRLEWRPALQIFEQVRTLEPDDLAVRKSLIDLNFRLDQPSQAGVELDDLLAQLHSTGQGKQAIPLLEELAGEYPKLAFLHRDLAEEYRQAGRIQDALIQLNSLGKILLEGGDRQGAIQTIETILTLNPPNPENFKSLLAKIRAKI